MTVGERIKSLRLKKGLTQEQLADSINTTKQTIYKYENNIITNIPYDKVLILTETLGIHPAELIGWDITQAENDKRLKVLLQYYSELNDIGKNEALNRLKELSYIPKYNDFASTVE